MTHNDEPPFCMWGSVCSVVSWQLARVLAVSLPPGPAVMSLLLLRILLLTASVACVQLSKVPEGER